MGQKISEFIADLAEKAGIDTASDELKPILSITAEMPEDVAKKINTALISVEDAKSHKGIKDTIIKTYGAGLLQRHEEVLRELGLPDEDIKEIAKETTIGKKIELAISKVAAHKSKPDPNATADQKALNEKIAELNKELNSIKTTHIPKEDLEKEVAKFESERMEGLKEEYFGKHTWSEAYKDKDIRKAAYNTKLNKFLEETGTTLQRNGENIKIVTKEGSDYFDGKNKIITFDEVVNQIMANNKFNAVSTQTSSTQTTVLEGVKNPTPKGNSTSYKKTMDLIQKSLMDQESNKAQ
jgi:hypothetical protein